MAYSMCPPGRGLLSLTPMPSSRTLVCLRSPASTCCRSLTRLIPCPHCDAGTACAGPGPAADDGHRLPDRGPAPDAYSNVATSTGRRMRGRHLPDRGQAASRSTSTSVAIVCHAAPCPRCDTGGGRCMGNDGPSSAGSRPGGDRRSDDRHQHRHVPPSGRRAIPRGTDVGHHPPDRGQAVDAHRRGRSDRRWQSAWNNMSRRATPGWCPRRDAGPAGASLGPRG
jgi:hypothetical protein